MAWVDKWVQDADTTEPPNSTSPVCVFVFVYLRERIVCVCISVHS